MSFKKHIEEEYGVLTEASIPNVTPDIRLPGVPTVGRYFPAGSVGPEGIPYYGGDATREKETFKSIVIHHTAGGSFAGARDEAFRLRNGSWYAGYHFIVDTNGTVYQMAPESVRTNHSTDHKNKSGLFNNRRSMGVSFVGGASGPFVPTGRQREMGLTLIAGLMKKYRIKPNAIAAHYMTDVKSNDEGKWIYDAIKSGELNHYLGNSKVTANFFADVVQDVQRDIGTSGGALTGLAIAGILLGGAYAFKRFLRRKNEYEEAMRIMDDRETKMKLLMIRNQHKDLIERAKDDPRAADLLKRVMSDAITGPSYRAF